MRGEVRGVKSAQPGLDKTYPLDDGGKRARSPGSTKETVKTIACGNAGRFRCTRCYSCAFYYYKCTRGRGCILCRPGERAVPFVFGTLVDTFRNHKRRWLWVPAFAGTTKESASASRHIHQDALASSYDEISIRLPSGSRQ